MLLVHGIRERDGLIAREAQEAVPFRIDDIYIETSLRGVGSEHGIQLAVGCGRRTVERNLANMLRQAHAALHTEFPDASGLETQLDQARLHDRAQFRGLMVGRQIAGHQSDETVAIPPYFLDNLISRPVEVDAVDVGGGDDVALGPTES